MTSLFGRQWFSSDAQIGLDRTVLHYEGCIRSKEFSKARELLSTLRRSGIPDYYLERQSQRLEKIACRKRNVPLYFHFSHFWPNFKARETYFWRLIKKLCHNTGLLCSITYDPEEADIVISSCFNMVKQTCGQASASTRILYLGENVRPSYSMYDYSVSSDLYTYLGRNVYYPNWIEYLAAESRNISHDVNPKLALWTLWHKYNEDSLSWSDRSDRAIFIGNNYTPLRSSVIYELESSGLSVDVYGSQTRPAHSKIELYGSSKIVLALENSHFPGYSTEKIIDTLLSGAVVLHWGHLDKDISRSATKRLVHWSNSTDNIQQLNEKLAATTRTSHCIDTLMALCQQLRRSQSALEQFLAGIIYPYI